MIILNEEYRSIFSDYNCLFFNHEKNPVYFSGFIQNNYGTGLEFSFGLDFSWFYKTIDFSWFFYSEKNHNPTKNPGPEKNSE